MVGKGGGEVIELEKELESAKGVLKIGRRRGPMTCGEIKTLYGFVKTQAALVVETFV